MGLLAFLRSSLAAFQSPGPGTDPVHWDEENLVYRNTSVFRGFPVGGIGCGGIGVDTAGGFTELRCNNNWMAPIRSRLRGCFWACSFTSAPAGVAGTAHGTPRTSPDREIFVLRRQCRGGPEFKTLTPVHDVEFHGALPHFRQRFTLPVHAPVFVQVQGFSPLIPHNVRDSSLPLAFFDVTLTNHGGGAGDASFLFSWENALGIGGSGQTGVHLVGGVPVGLKGAMKYTDTKGNRARPFCCGDWAGLEMGTTREDVRGCQHRRSTLGAYFLAVQKQAGVSLSAAPCWDAADDAPPSLQHFKRVGCLPVSLDESAAATWTEEDASTGNTYSDGDSSTSRHGPWSSGEGSGNAGSDGVSAGVAGGRAKPPRRPAGTLCATCRLAPGASTTVRFVLLWWMPEHVVENDPVTAASRGRHSGTDVGHFYQNVFGSPRDLLAHAGRHLSRLAAESSELQEMVFHSSLPRWLALALVNSAAPLVTNSVLPRSGRLYTLEGADWGWFFGGLTGTNDQRLAAQPFAANLFASLDLSEVYTFRSLHARGSVPHGNGNCDLALGKQGGGHKFLYSGSEGDQQGAGAGGREPEGPATNLSLVVSPMVGVGSGGATGDDRVTNASGGGAAGVVTDVSAVSGLRPEEGSQAAPDAGRGAPNRAGRKKRGKSSDRAWDGDEVPYGRPVHFVGGPSGADWPDLTLSAILQLFRHYRLTRREDASALLRRVWPDVVAMMRHLERCCPVAGGRSRKAGRGGGAETGGDRRSPTTVVGGRPHRLPVPEGGSTFDTSCFPGHTFIYTAGLMLAALAAVEEMAAAVPDVGTQEWVCAWGARARDHVQEVLWVPSGQVAAAAATASMGPEVQGKQRGGRDRPYADDGEIDTPAVKEGGETAHLQPVSGDKGGGDKGRALPAIAMSCGYYRSTERKDTVFLGAMAGDWFARYAGLPPVLPAGQVRAHLAAQHETLIAPLPAVQHWRPDAWNARDHTNGHANAGGQPNAQPNKFHNNSNRGPSGGTQQGPSKPSGIGKHKLKIGPSAFPCMEARGTPGRDGRRAPVPTRAVGMVQIHGYAWQVAAYHGLEAIYLGLVSEGLETVQALYRRMWHGGWPWSGDLFGNAGAVYMTNPVLWALPYALTGVGLDLPNETLHLSPRRLPQGWCFNETSCQGVWEASPSGTRDSPRNEGSPHTIHADEERQHVPVFFPQFWAMVTTSYPASGSRPGWLGIHLEIRKHFGDPIHVRTCVARDEAGQVIAVNSVEWLFKAGAKFTV
eukprot:jgi/Mesvir1/8396/Mv12640-RA.1